jgi:cation:H+ antiporter
LIENIVFVAVGLAGLFFGGEWLVTGAARLARSFGISALLVGLTVVAFGTSVPEMLVSLQAALAESSDISVGNIIGSNIANIGLILGATGIVFPIAIHVAMLKREIPILMIVTLATAVIVSNGYVSRLDGVLLLLGLVAFNLAVVMFVRIDRQRGTLAVEEAELESQEEPPITVKERLRELGRLLVGLAILLVGAQLTVNGSVAIARTMGVSELVIGITLVALGTSLPELATCLVAAFRQQSDIAIGNVVGSNIYNLLGVLGITALVHPVDVAQDVIHFDGPVMLAFTLVLVPLVLNRVISRKEAAMLLIAYMTFVLYVTLS